MTPDDARKLLGGYATGTLTPAEREALFAAALEDQDLFDALMKEEPLREMLDDPASRSAVLAALEEAPARRVWWSWRPLIGAIAMAGVALTAIAVWRANVRQEPPVITAELQKTVEPASPPAVPAPAPQARQSYTPAAAPAKRARPAASKPAAPDAVAAIRSAEAPSLRDQAAPAPKDTKAEAVAADARAPAAAPAAAPVQAQAPAPSPRAEQQSGQLAVAPSPSRVLEAASGMNQAAGAGVQQFRSTQTKTVAEATGMAKKALGPLQWSILRTGVQVAPGTALAEGDEVRLRVSSDIAGVLTITEGDKVIASASVTPDRTYDSPPIPFTVAAIRRFVLRVMPATGPATLPVEAVLDFSKR